MNELLDLEDSDLGENGYAVVHTKPQGATNEGFGLLTFYQKESDRRTTWELGTNYNAPLAQSGLTTDSAPPIFQVMYRIRITSIAEDGDSNAPGGATKRDYLHKFTSAQQTASNHKRYTEAIPEAYSLSVDEQKLYRRVYLEFSWPATSKKESRSTRTFIREYYYQFN